VVSLVKSPLNSDACWFKFSKPNIYKDGDLVNISFAIIHNIKLINNIPISFKFYGDDVFVCRALITCEFRSNEKNEILKEKIVFEDKTREYIVHIRDQNFGKLRVHMILEIEKGLPIVEVEIMENEMCKIYKERKLIIDKI
jgi:hypothetical protein